MTAPTPGLKDKELQAYYESLFAMYGVSGWKALMEDVQRMHETHNTPSDLTTVEQLWYRKGELSMMEWLLSHQGSIEKAFNAMIAEQEGTDEEAATGGVAKLTS